MRLEFCGAGFSLWDVGLASANFRACAASPTSYILLIKTHLPD